VPAKEKTGLSLAAAPKKQPHSSRIRDYMYFAPQTLDMIERLSAGPVQQK